MSNDLTDGALDLVIGLFPDGHCDDPAEAQELLALSPEQRLELAASVAVARALRPRVLPAARAAFDRALDTASRWVAGTLELDELLAAADVLEDAREAATELPSPAARLASHRALRVARLLTELPGEDLVVRMIAAVAVGVADTGSAEHEAEIGRLSAVAEQARIAHQRAAAGRRVS